MTTINKLILGLLGLAMLGACDEDDSQSVVPNPSVPVSVRFGNNLSIAENAGEKAITLAFTRDALQDGVIVLSVTTDFEESFTTNPPTEEGEIVLEVSKGNASASFTLTPADNSDADGIKHVAFSFKSFSEGFQAGTKNTLDLSITDDESPAQPVLAEFVNSADSIMENGAAGHMLKIRFNQEPVGGTIQIKQTGNLLHFRTSPPADIDGIITLPVSEGSDETWIAISPVNDALLKGHQVVSFELLSTETIQAGSKKTQTVKIFDDELRGKAKSFESFGGGWSAKHTYEYDEQGRIAKVHWENRTPGYRGGTLTYTYASNGLIENVNHYEGKDEIYFHENGRVVRSETIKNGIKEAYSLFDYDPAGNVGGRADYHIQPGGVFLMTDIWVYLHYNDGNLYKMLNYAPGVDGGEPELRSETTYEEYIHISNPFPLMELLPNMNSQPNWPGTYQVIDNN